METKKPSAKDVATKLTRQLVPGAQNYDPISEAEDFGGKCPCGRDTRYVLFRDEKHVNSCNKYQRCPTYNELQTLYEAEQKRANDAERQVEAVRSSVRAIMGS